MWRGADDKEGGEIDGYIGSCSNEDRRVGETGWEGREMDIAIYIELDKSNI